MTLLDWPDPRTIPIIGNHYQTPNGLYPRVTNILKVLGLGKEHLMKWAANLEHDAVLEACKDVYLQGGDRSPAEFQAAVEHVLGPARQHQRALRKGGDIGTAAHQEIQRRINLMLGLPVGPEQTLPDEVMWAVMAWEDWWKGAGLTPFRAEQPIYDDELQYAGTIDLLAYDRDGRLGITDLKTSKWIYDEYHLQVMGYVKGARNFAPIEWATLLRVPKTIEDPEFEVRPLGKLYDRTLTEEQLMAAFESAVVLHRTLIHKQK